MDEDIKAAAGIVLDCEEKWGIDDAEELTQHIHDDVAREIIWLEFQSLLEAAMASNAAQIKATSHKTLRVRAKRRHRRRRSSPAYRGDSSMTGASDGRPEIRTVRDLLGHHDVNTTMI